MDPRARLRWLRVALLAAGVICLAVFPLTLVWPAGWSWNPRGSHSEQMIVVVYTVLGVFLLRAARDPLRHVSLIWFSIWSGLAHGGLMAIQAMTDASERAHMLGDVPALLIGSAILAVLTPRSAAGDGKRIPESVRPLTGAPTPSDSASRSAWVYARTRSLDH